MLESPGRKYFHYGIRLLGLGLLERWKRKCSPETTALIRAEIQELLLAQGLTAQGTLAALQAECARPLGKTLEELITGWRGAAAEAEAETVWGGDLSLGRLKKVLDQVDRCLGIPEEVSLQSATVPALTQEAAGQIGLRYRQVFDSLIGNHLERPGYRLGGAVEAIHQAKAQVERVLQLQETQLRELGGPRKGAYRTSYGRAWARGKEPRSPANGASGLGEGKRIWYAHWPSTPGFAVSTSCTSGWPGST